MKIKIISLITVLCISFLSGCAISPSVEVLQEFKPESKTIVFLNSTRFNNKFRIALSKYGFKVKKYASIDRVKKKNTDDEVTFNKAEADFGIEYHYEQVDYCLIGNGKKINVFLELVDLNNNDVVLYLERGGWTESCGVSGTLFSDIAKELNQYW
tara:strand:+ start:943 stop:1407 length:465 start_codon:yes stop_codon:yes gene_type:complete